MIIVCIFYFLTMNISAIIVSGNMVPSAQASVGQPVSKSGSQFLRNPTVTDLIFFWPKVALAESCFFSSS
jgi:hypothetical protein